MAWRSSRLIRYSASAIPSSGSIFPLWFRSKAFSSTFIHECSARGSERVNVNTGGQHVRDELRTRPAPKLGNLVGVALPSAPEQVHTRWRVVTPPPPVPSWALASIRALLALAGPGNTLDSSEFVIVRPCRNSSPRLRSNIPLPGSVLRQKLCNMTVFILRTAIRDPAAGWLTEAYVADALRSSDAPIWQRILRR
jgi:hypothetical protein